MKRKRKDKKWSGNIEGCCKGNGGERNREKRGRDKGRIRNG